ncbi:putative bifunctional diguanylate cyclase/phosphodiesterase [Bounagaea algeriensis]
MSQSSHLLHRDALVSLRERLTPAQPHEHDRAELRGQLEALDEAIRLADPPRSPRLVPGLFDLVPLPLGILDESGQVLDANEALSDLLDYDQNDLVGRNARELLSHADGAGALAGPDVPNGQQRMLAHSDGHPTLCEVHSAPSAQEDDTRLWLVVAYDITPHHQHIQQLQHQATHDELTGLLNRQGLQETLADGAEQELPSGFAVLFCDVDNFKRVNESRGHPAGDELLTAVANLLHSTLPPSCHLARFSGDEFLITCPDVDSLGGLETFAAQVSDSLRATVPVRGQFVRISGSVGAAATDGAARSLNDLIRFADAAMFEAKQRGPGHTALANTELITAADDQLELEDQLRHALAHEQLSLHYQAIVAGDGSTLGAEALLRWEHPTRGMLSPALLLPVAEHGNLLGELERWVLRTALDEAAHWPAPDHGPIDIAVNLSELPSSDPSLLDDIASLITESGIDPHRVILEITETAVLNLHPWQLRAMTALSETGVRFAIDDFGTGYSSLARLQDLPAQIIKLDRSFIPDTDNDTTACAITRAIVDLCRATGHRCLAEGVETTAQLRLLEPLGIAAYQGWLFSHALPAPEFRRTLQNQHRTPTSGGQ